jgi:hypothetical protein
VTEPGYQPKSDAVTLKMEAVPCSEPSEQVSTTWVENLKNDNHLIKTLVHLD